LEDHDAVEVAVLVARVERRLLLRGEVVVVAVERPRRRKARLRIGSR
jgi:hypothetical protein